MTPNFVLRRLQVSNVRNLRNVEFDPSPKLNVLSGHNGQGKTSVLEAIYLLATSRSFRTSKLLELPTRDAGSTDVTGHFSEHPGTDLELNRTQHIGLHGGSARVHLDGKKPTGLALYATRSPIIVFHPAELVLTTGPSEHRRLLLDRIALFAEPSSSHHRTRYQHALRARQRLLRQEGHFHAPSELDAYEELCARHGAHLASSRRRAYESLAVEASRAFSRIAAPNLFLELRYQPGGSEDPAAALLELQHQRPRDQHRSSASFGPHRDELHLTLNGQPARSSASQGQHRALTLALKVAETACIASARGLDPIVLLDDVSSELDAERTSALLDYLADTRGQLFLTTTRPELLASAGLESQRTDYRLHDGTLTRI